LYSNVGQADLAGLAGFFFLRLLAFIVEELPDGAG
jgi:hypothetical protein